MPVDDPEAIQRRWLTSEKYYVAYEDDGTWAVSETPDGGPFVTGTYTFEDGLLVELTKPDSQTCVGSDGGQTGSYEISFLATGDEISMIRTTVEDPCFDGRTDS